MPEILRSGHHGEIDKWRRQESLRRTLEHRPDLLETADLTPTDREFLANLGYRAGTLMPEDPANPRD